MAGTSAQGSNKEGPVPASVDFEVRGMHCAACAARVEKVLAALPGGQEAVVNFATGRARVAGKVAPDRAVAAVKAIGYELIPVVSRQAAAPARPATPSLLPVVTSAALALPVVVLGMGLHDVAGSGWTQLGLTTVILAWPGCGFFARAARLLAHGGVSMDTLVALGVGAAYAASAWSLFTGGQDWYFESAAVIITLVLVGQALEGRARAGALAAVQKLRDLAPATARRVAADGSDQEVPLAELAVGDLIAVRPGAKVPTDGVVIEGESSIDEALLTGEAGPVRRGPGDPVVGATINSGSGRLLVRCTAVAGDTVLAHIVSLVEDAQASKASVQRLVDRVSSIFVPAVLVVAAATLLVWRFVLGADLADALGPAVAVLVVACPCALGLATPTAILVGTGRAARELILIRSAPGLERAGNLTAVVVDKTGTLTEGRPRVTAFHVAPGLPPTLTPAAVLAAVAAVESASQHPLATALVTYATLPSAGLNGPVPVPDRKAVPPRSLPMPASAGPALPNTEGTEGTGLGGKGLSSGTGSGSEDPALRLGSGTGAFRQDGGTRLLRATEQPGLGMEATVQTDTGVATVLIGSQRLLSERGVALPPGWRALAEAGIGSVFCAIDGRAAAAFTVEDPLRPSSAGAVKELAAMGLRVIMATGDRPAVAARVAAALGIGDVRAGLLPAAKLELVAGLRTAGERVAMVGDGINDAPALAAADVGIAVGGGTDIAMDAAAIVIPLGNLAKVATAIRISQATMRVIHQNLGWAFMYNVLAIPVAAGGRLSPMIAAAAMACSSVSVVGNSLRLRR